MVVVRGIRSDPAFYSSPHRSWITRSWKTNRLLIFRPQREGDVPPVLLDQGSLPFPCIVEESQARPRSQLLLQ